MKELMLILFSAMITDNFVLSKFMGICPFLGVSKKADSSLGMGTAVTIVMILAQLCTYPVYKFFLLPFDLVYLRTVVFILIIALFVQILEMAVKKLFPPLYRALGVYLPLITTNCAVLGVTILNADNEYTFIESITGALGAGLGFTAAMLIFSGVRSRTENADIPAAFKGAPSTLIAASVVSLAFMGFSGIAEGIFGGFGG